MASAQSDRNLLFGILAVQMDFIGRDELVAAMHAWVLDKGKPLGLILQERGALSGPHREALEALVRAHLERHGNDTQRSLAAVSSVGEVRREVGRVTDPDVQASLAHVPATRADAGLTGPYESAGPPPQSRYRVLRPHAAGGLGLVSVALDEELRREVALKEIRPEHAGHPESRARFLLEAEVTGGLEHPGVVPVYGLGCYPDGRPYYAMRFIRGESLRDAIQGYHKEKADLPAGERGLRLRQLLGRFVAVCNAVAYAHSRGVLHRDLKPANVMVGKYGETLVVDWGLAKVLAGGAEQTEGALRPARGGDPTATQPGAALGTPAYMPPEQAAGRPDLLGARSDVYSLGATLYTLLTGRPPLTELDAAEVLRRVQRGDFPRPREVSPDVPAALEAVCLKALALRPEGRYASAQELAGDVERWLADEPVSAYREPLPARLARWSRRHRASVLSAAAALAVLALSLGVLAAVLSSHNRALAAANGREREARGRESEAKDKARANFRLARQAVKDYCVAVTLSPRLKEADLTDLRKELLTTAARFHAKFKEQEGDDPDVRRERAYAYFELAYIAKETGAAEEALGHYQRSLALWVPLVEAHPDNRDYRRGLAATYNDAASLYASLGRAAEAEDANRKALTLYQELADAAPEDAAAQVALGRSSHNLGLWFAERGRWKEAEDHYGKALALFQALADADAGNAPALRGLAATRHSLGYLYFHTGRREKAGESYQQALAARERLSQDHPGQPRFLEDLGWSYLNLGQWYRAAGRTRDAEGAYKRVLEVWQKLADGHPSVPQYQFQQAGALSELGLLYQAGGRTQEALGAYRRALDIQEQLANRYPANVQYAVSLGGSYCNMGLRLAQNGEAEAALEWFDKAQAKLEEVRRRDRTNARAAAFLRNTHWNRGFALSELRRDAVALGEWDRAATFPASDAERRSLQLGRALALARLGKYGEAVPLAEQLAGRPDLADFDCVRAARVLSLAAGQAGRQELAEKYAAGAVALLRQAQAKGYFKDPRNVTSLKKDKDLDPLRQRPDFQKLLKELSPKP
jgi:serine/threonine-protein kinase